VLFEEHVARRSGVTPVGISTHPNSSVLTGVTAPFSLSLVLLLHGCVGDPDLASSSGELRGTADGSTEQTIERGTWERALAGCEDLDRAHTEIFAAADEPLLGVLVSLRGSVLCVDSMSLLARERLQETREDPTPTPLSPLCPVPHRPGL